MTRIDAITLGSARAASYASLGVVDSVGKPQRRPTISPTRTTVRLRGAWADYVWLCGLNGRASELPNLSEARLKRHAALTSHGAH